MKLNNTLRDGFIQSVMNDVPIIDPSRETVQTAFYNQFPESIKTIFQHPELRKHLNTCSVYALEGPTFHGIVCGDLDKDEVLADFLTQIKARNATIMKLRSVAYGCKTTEQLESMLPELKFHMPSEVKGVTVGVPMVIGVMDDLKNLGFKPHHSDVVKLAA